MNQLVRMIVTEKSTWLIDDAAFCFMRVPRDEHPAPALEGYLAHWTWLPFIEWELSGDDASMQLVLLLPDDAPAPLVSGRVVFIDVHAAG